MTKDKFLNPEKKLLARRIYLYLGAIFITSLVVSNLIFQKFIFVDFFNIKMFGVNLFEVSVGILPYPITFLVTDLISEMYGRKKANEIVVAGIFASLFSILIITIADILPAIDYYEDPLKNSPIDDETFNKVFSKSLIAVSASMASYLFAQFVDIRVYHFWKNLTKGKMLWLRNNFSTFFSQILDTFTIIFLLCSFNIIAWEMFKPLFISGVLFKMLIALIDTPLLYLGVYLFRRKFNLEINEEININ